MIGKTFDKKNNKLSRLLGISNSPRYSHAQMRDLNRDYLKESIGYLRKLKTENRLSDKEFSMLLTRICSNYVESELQIRIKRVFKDFV